MEIFNNREIAVGFWLFIITLWVFAIPDIRKSILDVFKALFKAAILMPIILMIGYIILIVYGLNELGVWTNDQLKNTILWGGSVAIVSLFRINEIAENTDYFRTAIRDTLKLIVVLEFVIAFYTFDLWVEFLIVPISTLLILMQATAKIDNKDGQVEQILENLMMWFGAGLIFYAAFKLFSDFGSFAQLNTLADFYLPLILSLLLLPFIFVLALYLKYDTAFSRLQLSIENEALRSYAKRSAVFAFHFRTEQLKRWVRNLMFIKPDNRQEIKDAIQEVKISWKREQNPENVHFNLGWSPYAAQKFLIIEGLTPSDYHRSFCGSDEWHADSQLLELDENFIPNNIAYYIDGNEMVATRLKLVFNVNAPEAVFEARQKFCNTAELLFANALDHEIPEDIKNNLLSEVEMTTSLNGKAIIISKELWPAHRRHGYTLNFIIQNY